MSLFSEGLPQWDNAGTDPGGTKKTNGWGVNEKPPAAWFNWLFHRGYKCLQEMQTVVDALGVSLQAANVISYGASATGNDGYVITPTPAIVAYAAGMVTELTVDVGNTGAATVNVSGKGVKNIKKLTAAGKVDIVTGDIIAGGTYTLVYDGTDQILVNPNAVNTSLFLAPGDMSYASAPNTIVRFPVGSEGQVITSVGGVPAWVGGFAKSTTGSYVGNDPTAGSTDREINIGFPAKLVLISYYYESGGYKTVTIGFASLGGGGGIYGAKTYNSYVETNDINSLRPKMSSNGFTVAGGFIGGLNRSGTVYTYVAIG
jgi:hypothetical protein